MSFDAEYLDRAPTTGILYCVQCKGRIHDADNPEGGRYFMAEGGKPTHADAQECINALTARLARIGDIARDADNRTQTHASLYSDIKRIFRITHSTCPDE